MKKNIIMLFAALFSLSSVMMFVWFFISYVQVLSLNLAGDPSYPAWNFFVYLLDLFA